MPLLVTIDELETVDEVIGNHLAAIRGEAGLTQAELADYLTKVTGNRWNQQLVSRAEKGKRPFRVYDLFAIAGLFEVSVLALMAPADEGAHLRIGNIVLAADGMTKYWYHFPRLHLGDNTYYTAAKPAAEQRFHEHVEGFIDAITWLPGDGIWEEDTEERP